MQYLLYLKQKHMSEKLITMPSEDEIYDAFNKAIQQGTPENKKGIVRTFEPFLAKAKAHVKNLIIVKDAGLECVFSTDIGDKLIHGFVDSQGFLLKIPLQAALVMFGADSFTNFVKATKEGKNNPTTTIGGLTAILTAFVQILGEKYVMIDTPETIKAKVEAAFA